MRLFAALLVSIGALFAQPAAAYPDKPVKILVGFTPGATADTSARLIAEKLTEKFAQQFIVENKTGAAGIIAAQSLLNSAPDGGTLMLGTGGMMTIMPAIKKDLPFNVLTDFTPVASLISSTLYFVVRKDLPVNTIGELVEYAKRNPGKVTYTSPGTGTLNHMGMERFASLTGIQLERIPFRGDAEALTAIMGDQVDIGFIAPPLVLAQINSGRVKVLAVPTPERSSAIPNVPTVREQGVDFDLISWVGIVGPRGLPANIVSKLNVAINDALGDEKLLKRFDALGFIAMVNTPESFAKHIEKELSIWRDLASRLHISLD